MENDDPFDLVLLDLTVRGGMGGEEAMEKILQLDSKAVGIVSSGYSESPIMSDSKSYGFQDYLAKPYRPEELEQVLNRFLSD